MTTVYRRLTSILLCALLVTIAGGGLTAAPAHAEGPASAGLPQVVVAPDGVEVVALDLDAAGSAVVAIDLRVTWDPQVVRVDAAELGDLGVGWAMSSNLSVPGQVRLAMAGTQAISGSGTLVELTLVAVGGEGSSTPLTLAQCALNDGTVACTPSHGQATIGTQTPQYRLQIPLVMGWNLVSLSVVPSSLLVSDVLASIDGQYERVMAYDAQTPANPWRSYGPGIPAYANSLQYLAVGQGFWIKATANATLVIDGAATGRDVTLVPGWNLVGLCGTSSVPVPDALAGLDGQYDLVYAFDAAEELSPWEAYDPSGDAWTNSLTALEPGMGYWILMNQPGVWSSSS